MQVTECNVSKAASQCHVNNSVLLALLTEVKRKHCCKFYINGLVQDCGNSIANALELPQSSAKPSVYCWEYHINWSHVVGLINRVKRSASSWTSPTCWTRASWSVWIHCWPMVKYPACLRVTSWQHWWHNARRVLSVRAPCWTLRRNSTSGSHNR